MLSAQKVQVESPENGAMLHRWRYGALSVHGRGLVSIGYLCCLIFVIHIISAFEASILAFRGSFPIQTEFQHDCEGS